MTSNATKSIKNILSKLNNSSQHFFLFCLLPTIVMLLVNLIWFTFDHRLPSWDDAGHIMSSLRFCDFFGKPELWSSIGIDGLMKINSIYPPFVYIVSGITKLVLGKALWTEIVVQLTFIAITCISIYGIVMQTIKDSLTGALAIVSICTIPLCISISHERLLDYPLMSMVAFGLWCLIAWYNKPGWKNAIYLGFVLGLACLTKQIAAIYLSLPCIALLIYLFYSKRFKHAGMLSLSGIFTVLIILPWYLTNRDVMQAYALPYEQLSTAYSFFPTLFSRLLFYANSLSFNLSPILLIVFLATLIRAPLTIHKQLILPIISALGGLIAFNSIDWLIPQQRYTVPSMILVAVYTGYGMACLWKKQSRTSYVLSIVIVSIIGLQSLTVCFTPYPVSTPQWISALPKVFFLSDNYLKLAPVSYEDWGWRWIFETITKNPAATRLNVLTNTKHFNHGNMLCAAAIYNKRVYPLTFRYWTIIGDRVDYEPEKLLEIKWHLLKTGYQGQYFEQQWKCREESERFRAHVIKSVKEGKLVHQDSESARNYRKMQDFIRNSEHFKLYDSKKLPDGETLLLYLCTESTAI